MIKIRTTKTPNEIDTYECRRDIEDLVRWGMVLEIVYDDEDPTRFTNDTGEPETVMTEEQLKRVTRLKTSPESDSGDEQE